MRQLRAVFLRALIFILLGVSTGRSAESDTHRQNDYNITPVPFSKVNVREKNLL